MEIPLDLSPIFGGEMIRLDSQRLKQINNITVHQAIDDMGQLSSSSVMSNRALTTTQRIMDHPEQTLYVLWQKGTEENQSFVLGYVKVGNKSLYLYDKSMKGVQSRTICVFDFYIHYTQQRKGLGRKLFDFMVQNENSVPGGLALDNPSMAMLAFAAKHYNLCQPIWQNTNYVVFDQFFDFIRASKECKSNVGPAEETRPSTPQRPPNEPCGKDGMRDSPVGDQSTEGTLANRAQQCRARKVHILGHVPLW